MPLPDAVRWTDLLWGYFRRQIEAGAPVYFAVDSALLRELADIHDENVGPGDVARAFHATCQTLFELGSAKAGVRDVAFRKISGREYSYTILLAIQQVLVVEAMLNEEELDISENAYFPRYRECLGLEAHEMKSNPLVGGQFRDIWDALETEISRVPGCTEKTITFFSGSGPDLNRKLPFTQALLTTHDLSVVKERVPKLTETSESTVILHALYRVRGHLCRRAQKLVTSAESGVRERICRQVRSFLANHDKLSTIRKREAVERGGLIRLVAFLDREELFEDIFNVFVVTKGQQQTLGEESAEVKRKVEGSGFIPLVARGDKYVEVDSTQPVFAGDALLLLHKTDATESVKERVVRTLGVADNAMVAPRICNVPGYAFLYCESVPDAGLAELLAGFVTLERNRRVGLSGGLLADVRSRIYLSGYAPTGITWDGKPLEVGSRLLVSGVERTIGEFLESLRPWQAFGSFQVVYLGEQIDFAVAARTPEVDKLEYGYPIEEGTFSSIAFALDPGKAGLRGLVTTVDTNKVVQVDSEELRQGLVFPILRGESRCFAVDESRRDWLVKQLEGLDVPKPLLELVVATIREGKIPFSPYVRKLLGEDDFLSPLLGRVKKVC